MGKYTKEMLEPIVASSINWATVCRQLGIKPMSGSQTHIKKRATEFGIDYSHFLGSASNKGRKFPPSRPIEDYLVVHSTINSHALKKRLIKEGVKKAQCEICGLTVWQGELTPLELDHKNRDHYDNRLHNLQIICPNCHALKTAKDRRKGRLA